MSRREAKGEGVRLSGKKQTHSHAMGSVVVLGAVGEAREYNHGRGREHHGKIRINFRRFQSDLLLFFLSTVENVRLDSK